MIVRMFALHDVNHMEQIIRIRTSKKCFTIVNVCTARLFG